MTARRTGVLFLWAQAAGGAAWWAALLLWPESRTHFKAAGAPDATLLAFGPPDVLLYVVASAACAVGLTSGAPWGWPLLCAHAGAAAYAALYCWGLTAVTGGDGLLGAALMTPSLVVPGWLAWRTRPGTRERMTA
jgi:hypothetical protein